jgi:hypothetical protein
MLSQRYEFIVEGNVRADSLANQERKGLASSVLWNFFCSEEGAKEVIRNVFQR